MESWTLGTTLLGLRAGFAGIAVIARKCWQASGALGQLGDELGLVRHTITRHKITARVFRLEDTSSSAYSNPDSVGLTGLARKILRRWV